MPAFHISPKWTKLFGLGPGVFAQGGAADTSFSMTVTTTGAQQLKLDGLTVSASTTVDWGDNSSNDYTGSGSRTHNYAGAGTWTVTIKQPLNVTLIDLRDTKITSVTGANLSKMVNLTSLTLDGIGTALVWTVNDTAPMPSGITSLTLRVVNLTWNVGSVAGANMPSNITYLNLYSLPNLTWSVGSVAGANMPSNIASLTLHSLPNLTWSVGSVAGANMPSGITTLHLRDLPNLTWNVGSVAGANMPSNIASLTLYSLPNLTWSVGSVAGANMPSGITYLYLRDLPNLTWNVGSVAGANMPSNIASLTLQSLANLTWDVGSVAGANMPSGIKSLTLHTLANLTWDVGSVAGANMPANATSVTIVSTGTVTIAADDVLPAPMTTFRFENGLNAAAVDAVLAALYKAFPTRTGTAGTIDLLGTGNAAPTGVSPGSAECPPTTGWNTAYELVNDSCNVSPKHWASVSLQT